VLETQPGLEALLFNLEGVDQIVVKGETLPAFDFHCPLLSLPLAFGTRLDTIPAEVSYFACDPMRENAWRIKLGDKTKLRVGLAWSGNRDHKNDRNRSIALSCFVKSLPGSAHYVSLQKEVRDDDKPILEEREDIAFFGDDLVSFSETAALIANVDLVVSVDTAIAHLAGAMGKPVWILLPFNPDWRWLLDRSDSPWYPTARLYRQTKIGDWDSVMSLLANEVGALSRSNDLRASGASIDEINSLCRG